MAFLSTPNEPVEKGSGEQRGDGRCGFFIKLSDLRVSNSVYFSEFYSTI
jgi:hypothetical protein